MPDGIGKRISAGSEMAATMVAAAMATPPVITRLGGSSPSSPRASLSKVQLSSGTFFCLFL